jgi:hypothetical protein
MEIYFSVPVGSFLCFANLIPHDWSSRCIALVTQRLPNAPLPKKRSNLPRKENRENEK